MLDAKRIPVDVTALDVVVSDGFKIRWDGREIDSGPVLIELGESGSRGVIDYEMGTVDVEFRIRIVFPELAESLGDMGADPDLLRPIDVVIRSEGSVFDEDHSLRLAGKGQLLEHALFDPEETTISIRAPSH